jgi:hypothetical protein
MTSARDRRHAEPLSDEVVNAFFDRELTDGASEVFFSKLRSDLPRCAEVARMQRAISLLREPIEAPDVSARVLAEVHRRRRFIPESLRRFVTAGRLAAAGVALAGVLGLFVVERVSPGALRLSPRPRPVSEVVQHAAQDAVQGVSGLAGGTRTVVVLPGPELKDEPARRASAAVHSLLELRPGVTSARLLATPRAGGDDSMIIYRGAGPDTRIVLPEVVYFDRNAAVVLPLGHMSPSRIGSMDWAGVSSDNLFLLPAIDPAEVVRAGKASPRSEDRREP